MPFLRRAFTRLYPTCLLAALAALGVIFWTGPAGALPYTATSRFDYQTGSGPYGSTSADVNNDGKPDVITANAFGDNVSVLINAGLGVYQAHVDYPVGDAPNSVMAFDVNYDGFQDLLVTNQNSNTTSILFGNGTGQFNTKVDYPSGTQPTRAVIAYVNGDGLPDLVTANKGSNNVSVRLGTGAGAFGAAVNYAVGTTPLWVTARDVNGDNFDDLVTANYNANSISILLSDGAGGYLPKVDIALAAQPQSVAFGYFNDDNKIDLAIALWSADRVAVLFGDGHGNFGSRINLITGVQPIRVCAADVNLDGATDIAVTNSSSNTMSVFFGTGLGTFADKVDFVTGSSPYGLEIDDVTGDGQPDLASCNVAANTITIRPGNVPGGFFVGDTLVDMTAMNQDQNPYTVSGGAGKWRIYEVCAVWCPSCNHMAEEVRQVCDTWANVHPLPFDYVTVLDEGAADRSLSTQHDALDWRHHYQQNTPVLHTNAKRQNNLQTWAAEVFNTSENAYPQVIIVDPQGKIRERHVGYLSGQALVNHIASFAGIAPAPTLAPALPPLPPDPPPAPTAPWRPLATASIEVHYGNASWVGPLGSPYDEGVVRRFQITPVGVPGIVDTEDYLEVVASTDSLTGLESLELFVGTYHTTNAVIQVAQPWQVRLLNMSWDDAQPRVLAATDDDVQLSYVTSDDQGFNVYGPTSLSPIGTYAGTTLEFSPFVLGTVPNLPDSTNGFRIGGVWLKHQFPVAGVFSHPRAAASLAPPSPNPARATTALRWAMTARGSATMQIVDVTGRVVRTLQQGIAEIGEHTSAWNLRDDQGARVAPGLYFVRFESAGQPTQTTRVAVMK